MRDRVLERPAQKCLARRPPPQGAPLSAALLRTPVALSGAHHCVVLTPHPGPESRGNSLLVFLSVIPTDCNRSSAQFVGGRERGVGAALGLARAVAVRSPDQSPGPFVLSPYALTCQVTTRAIPLNARENAVTREAPSCPARGTARAEQRTKAAAKK